MQISVFGCGRWGTFLAWYCHKIGHEVTLWGRESSVNLKKLINSRHNDYLMLPEDVKLTSDVEEATSEAQLVIISIGAQQLRSFLTELPSTYLSQKIVILCMKGLEDRTGKRLSEIVNEIIPDCQVAVWVGPGHVQDFVKGIPNCMLIGAEDSNLTKQIVSVLDSELIRFYYSEDLIGMELGAAAKNVMGIAAGMLDGLGYQSLKGALMARGAQEISRLIKHMGGSELTAYGLSHLGDYQATLFSVYSHNRTFGEWFAQNRKYQKLAEGVYTVQALMLISKKYQVELPICSAVERIISLELNAKDVLLELFLRPVKFEFNSKKD